jgi:hypothetical protein
LFVAKRIVSSGLLDIASTPVDTGSHEPRAHIALRQLALREHGREPSRK